VARADTCSLFWSIAVSLPLPTVASPQPPQSSDGRDEPWLARLRAAAVRHADPSVNDRLETCLGQRENRDLLAAVFGFSPFLADCLTTDPAIVADFAERGAAAIVEEELARIDALPFDRNRLLPGLRQARRRIAAAVGLADLAGRFDLDQVTRSLSRLADHAAEAVLATFLAESAKRGEIELADAERPTRDCGIFIVGMGKLGAHELNYSSDIDLIVLFDPDRIDYRGRETAMALAVRAARAIVYGLEHKSRDGYVFRTDLRLRPHPPGHPLALSVDAAEIYYERHGQNWERAAFIKARIIAGDRPAGETFLRRLAPFVWRRHLDYAAIRDIHSIKRQINAHRGFGTIGVRGHDLKVGRGGIREIEFFVQTQQLILGGRHPELRDPRTLTTLEKLVEGRWVDGAAGDDLDQAYRFLRALEHRLQMVADKQTQTLPTRDNELEQFARFAGFADTDTLSAAIMAVLQSVERHYAQLFEAEPDLGAGRQLVFTGTEDDPGTLETLREMGFKDPAAAAGRIRQWHHGHIRATRSTRAREILTELTPGILNALQRQADVDEAFRLFDAFLAGLPAGVQFFSLVRANPNLLTLIGDLMGAAPRLAQVLAGNVALFDAMLAPDFFEPLPDEAALEAEFAGLRRDARHLEGLLDLCRRWAQGRQFQAGLHVLLGLADAATASRALTSIAELVIRTLLPEAESWLEEQHGRIEGGSFCVLGLGKLGSRELSLGSDLDLVFLFEAPDDAVSDGAKPLPATTYYARLGQRLVSAISARTAEGRLFEIDTRLRPSGNVGPIACSLGNFRRYQETTAQVWERQSLTRARAVAGDPGLVADATAAIDEALARPAEPELLAREVRAMRLRIFKEHGSDSPWNLKHCRGGLVDLEFAAQYLVLRHGPDHPSLRRTDTGGILEAAIEAGLIEAAVGRQLLQALALLQALQAVLRLSLSDRFEPRQAPMGLREALVRAANRQLGLGVPVAHFAAVEELLVECETAARQFFDALCPPEEDGEPTITNPSEPTRGKTP
jgi:glutamate-ammonia-ligase adenylyltransferase